MLFFQPQKNSSEFGEESLCIYGPPGNGGKDWVLQHYPGIIDVTDCMDVLDRIPKTHWILFDGDIEETDVLIKRPRTIILSRHPVSGCGQYKEFRRTERTLFGTQDTFIDAPAEFVFQNMETDRPSYIDMMDTCIGEHGNNMGLIHENLTSAEMMPIEDIANALDSLGYAVELDTEMYKGNWDLYNYYSLFAYCIPCHIVKGRSRTQRAASMWTKYLNMCMKQKRLKDLNLDIDTLDLLKLGVLHGQNLGGLTRTQLDMVKCADFYKRIKTKALQALKKSAVDA